VADECAIRRAGPEDAETVLRLIDALADYEHLPRPDREARERLVRDGFGQQQAAFEVLLAEFRGQPAGYALYFYTYSTFLARPTLYLEDIFILPEHRRHWLGAALMRRLAQEAVERGCGRMEWHVLD
jgi:GNAT superfamily N-acetyltransferase